MTVVILNSANISVGVTTCQYGDKTIWDDNVGSIRAHKVPCKFYSSFPTTTVVSLFFLLCLQELVGHCASLYEQNAKAISALESRLQSYGYAEQYSPLPPTNPLDLLNGSDNSRGGGASQHPKFAAKQEALGMLSPTYSDVSDTIRDKSLSPTVKMDQQHMIVHPPPSTGQRRLVGPAAHLTAAQALAPMTAAKARTFRQDTPSSVSSPEDLTPSMRHLLGKYATTSSSEGIGSGRLSSFSFLSPAGSRPNSRRGTLLTLPSPSPVPLSPAPLSPAFAAAAEHQRAQIEEASSAAAAKEDDSKIVEETAEVFSAAPGGLGSPISLSSPLSINLNDSPSEIMQVEAADAFLASTAQKLANNPLLLDAYREKYPHIVASTERYLMSVSPVMPPSTGYTDGHNSTGNGTGGGYYDEESTMELKAQVIYNRALSGHQQVQYTGYQSMAMPSATTAVVASVTPGSADFGCAATAAAAQAQASAQALANQKSRESLEEAIAAALSRPSTTTATKTTSTTSTNSGNTGTATTTTTARTSYAATNPTPHVTPAATAGPMSGAPSAAGGARTLPSTRGGSLPASLTPSLPTSVAPWTPINDSEYSSLPGFVRGQMPLEVLNEAAATMHTSVVRRCAAGDGASFTMDDIEEAGALPVGKGKAFINALAKLGRVQLKVVYGRGTVYFFAE